MKTVDVSTIEGYAEMSAEDKVKALEAFEYEDNTAELERLKNSVSKSNAEAKSWKDKYNAKLTDEDKKKEAAEEAKKQEAQKFADLESKYNELLKQSTLKEHTISLTGLGFDEKLAGETATAIVDGDAAKLFANMKKFLETYRKTIEKELMDKTPGVSGNGAQSQNEEDPAIAFVRARAHQKAEAAKQADEVRKMFEKG